MFAMDRDAATRGSATGLWRKVEIRRSICRTALACVVAVLLLGSPAAWSQEVAASLEELVHSEKLEVGEAIYVTDSLGQRLTGSVGNVSASWLEIAVEHGAVVFAESELSEIALRDPTSNGVRLGVGVAAATYAVLCFLGQSPNCVKYLPNVGLSFMAIGAFVGWSTDYVMRETVYRKPASARLTVSPAESGKSGGVGMTLSW